MGILELSKVLYGQKGVWLVGTFRGWCRCIRLVVLGTLGGGKRNLGGNVPPRIAKETWLAYFRLLLVFLLQ